MLLVRVWCLRCCTSCIVWGMAGSASLSLCSPLPVGCIPAPLLGGTSGTLRNVTLCVCVRACVCVFVFVCMRVQSHTLTLFPWSALKGVHPICSIRYWQGWQFHFSCEIMNLISHQCYQGWQETLFPPFYWNSLVTVVTSSKLTINSPNCVSVISKIHCSGKVIL